MTIIAALTAKRVIGRRDGMPWHIAEELRHFKKLTTGHTLILGRKTFQSIDRSLPGRRTIVVSRSLSEAKGVEVCRSLDEAIRKAESYGREVFIAGGADIYRQALPLADALYLSYIKADYEGDVAFPEFDGSEWEITGEEEFPEFTFVAYRRRKR